MDGYAQKYKRNAEDIWEIALGKKMAKYFSSDEHGQAASSKLGVRQRDTKY